MVEWTTPFELLVFGWTMGVTSSAGFYYTFMFAGAAKWFHYGLGD